MTVFYNRKNKITVTDHANSKENPNTEVSAKLAFEIKKLGPLKNFLGIELVQSKETIFINQRVKKLLASF